MIHWACSAQLTPLPPTLGYFLYFPRYWNQCKIYFCFSLWEFQSSSFFYSRSGKEEFITASWGWANFITPFLRKKREMLKCSWAVLQNQQQDLLSGGPGFHPLDLERISFLSCFSSCTLTLQFMAGKPLFYALFKYLQRKSPAKRDLLCPWTPTDPA